MSTPTLRVKTPTLGQLSSGKERRVSSRDAEAPEQEDDEDPVGSNVTEMASSEDLDEAAQRMQLLLEEGSSMADSDTEEVPRRDLTPAPAEEEAPAAAAAVAGPAEPPPGEAPPPELPDLLAGAPGRPEPLAKAAMPKLPAEAVVVWPGVGKLSFHNSKNSFEAFCFAIPIVLSLAQHEVGRCEATDMWPAGQ